MSTPARPWLILPLLLFVSISPAAADCTDWDAVLPLVGQADGATNLQRVAVVGSWALAIDETGSMHRALLVYSIHDPEAPELVTSVPLRDWAEVIHCHDGMAYIAGGDTLAVYDIFEPANPQLVSELVVPGFIYDLDVEGNVCALATGESGLVLVNVSDPGFPSVLGSFVPPSWQGVAISVDLRGDRVLMGLYDSNDGYFYWFDVADPTAPAVLSSLSYHHPITQVHLIDDEPLGLVAAGWQLVSLALSDTEPIEVLGTRRGSGERLFIFDDLAVSMYFHTGDSMFLSLTDPVHPVWLATMERFAFDAARKSQYLILARGDAGLGIVQITDPAAVPIVGVEYSDVGRTTLYATSAPAIILELSASLGRARLVDVSDPAHPVARGTLPLNAPSWAAVRQEQAVILDANGARLVDLANPDAIVTLGTVILPATTARLTWVDDIYYVAAAANGLVIMDATDPLQPVELGRFSTPGSVRNVAMADGFAVIGDYASGIRTVDVSDPAAPFEIGHIFGVHGDLLVVDGARCFTGGTLQEAVVEVDLTDPSTLTVAATIPLPSYPNAILIADNFLWASTIHGVNVFDVTIAGSPTPAASLAGLPRAYGLAPVADGAATTMWQFVVLRPPCRITTAVTEPLATGRPLLHVAPNPFNPAASLSFALPRTADCRLTLYNLAGRRVRTLWSGWLEAGPHAFVWDGSDGSDRAAASGVYLARLVAPGAGVSATARLVLVR